MPRSLVLTCNIQESDRPQRIPGAISPKHLQCSAPFRKFHLVVKCPLFSDFAWLRRYFAMCFRWTFHADLAATNLKSSHEPVIDSLLEFLDSGNKADIDPH